jgi:hypothetical protein
MLNSTEAARPFDSMPEPGEDLPTISAALYQNQVHVIRRPRYNTVIPEATGFF